MTAAWLLMPGTPMLFQGQEFSATAPFLYFADFEEGLARSVREGRAKFLTQFPGIVGYQKETVLDDPGSVETFKRCKLNLAERESHAEAYALHKDLIHLRKSTEAFHVERREDVDGAVLSANAFALRFFTPQHRDDRVLVVNLGHDERRSSFAEPLLAPPAGYRWRIEWTSEHSKYGGSGSRDLWHESQWLIPGESAFVLAPSPTDHAVVESK